MERLRVGSLENRPWGACRERHSLAVVTCKRRIMDRYLTVQYQSLVIRGLPATGTVVLYIGTLLFSFTMEISSIMLQYCAMSLQHCIMHGSTWSSESF